MTPHEKIGGECIHCFGANTIEAHTKLEYVVVIFCTGVNFGYAVDNFTEWNAASEVADIYHIIFNAYVDSFAMSHDKFIDSVVDDFFDEDIDAIVIVRSRTGSPNIHTCSQANMFKG